MANMEWWQSRLESLRSRLSRDFGLMEIINTRFGRWTEAAKKFIAETRSARP